ncbi:unnamed protein product [Cylindrotheca closterium]|uniref:G-protein coupled receptors family 2 profile 2 domain-containing protein n=1 Tax=Cylindrotheca closterium TaxID=2856 RepID=A0AAD2FTB8_9STRA|nr:unnamed protein product [Cylindrotheca closterium]
MDQQYDLANVEQLSDAQEKALALLPLPSVVLSIIGSSVIIYVAINSRREQKWTPYTRLLIMMSAADILFSSTIGVGGFLRPSETSPRAWAFGSSATCSAIGFLNQIATSAVLYNAMLSCYFLLTARFNFRNSYIAKNVEPWMHFVSIGYPLLTATIGAAAGEYGEMTVNGLVCWLVKFPTNCGYGEGESGEECLSKFIGWVFYGLPVLVTFASIITNSLILVLFVQKQALPAPSNYSKRAPSMAQTERDQNKRLRLVRTQAILFLASFTVCIFWTGVLNSVESTAASKEEELALMCRWFPISVIQAIFMPLQGFLNMFVYLRPKYLKTRKEYPYESKFWSFKRSVFGQEIKPTRSNIATHLMTPIQDAKVERVAMKKKMSDKQKNAMVGAFDSNEVEFYDDNDYNNAVIKASHGPSSKKLSSKKLAKYTVSDMTASEGDFDHVMDEDQVDDRWDTEKTAKRPMTTPIKRKFQSSIIGGSSLEVISENSECKFEPISTPPLHSLPAPPPPPALSLQNMEGRWNADCKNNNSQSRSPTPSPVVSSDDESSTSEEEEESKDTPIMAPSRQRSEEFSTPSDNDCEDCPIRAPSRHLSDDSLTQAGEDPDNSEPIEPLYNPLASPLQVLQEVSNDGPIRAPARHMSSESLPGMEEESSSSDEAPAFVANGPTSLDTTPPPASTVNSPLASTRPAVDRQQVVESQSPVILPSQRPRPRLRGPAFFTATRH